jgi:UDP-glucose-4-epimerase GalE
MSTLSSHRPLLVIGGAGYIGSHTVRHLAEAGQPVVVLDNFSLGHRGAIVTPGVTVVAGELSDARLIESLFAAHDFDAVIHFAACSVVGESVAEPLKYYGNNVGAPLVVLEAMRRHRCQSFILSSTAATYGDPVTMPMDERHPQQPINPYGWSKFMLERILTDCEAAWGLRSVALRYFNAAGADPDAEIGELHDPETHLIPLALRAACPGDFRLQLFGTDYPTPDGTAIRDYVHVNDLASAHVLALEKLNTQMVNDVFNLGTGKGISVLQLLSTVSATVGSDVRYVASPRREGDPPVLVARADKAQRHLEWVPRHSAIENIVRDAWNWEQKNRIQRRPL